MQAIDALRPCIRCIAHVPRYCGVLAAMTFATAIVGVGALRRDYCHVTQLVSELGERGGEYSSLFNYAGFLPTGSLIVVFAFHLKKWLRDRDQDITAAVLVGIHGVGMAAAAWVSCDFTCHPSSPTPMQLGHDAIAAIKFPALIAATFVFSRRLRGDDDLKWLARFSSATGFASLILMTCFVATVEIRLVTGLFQRAFLTVLYAWICLVSIAVGRRPVERSPGVPSVLQ